jgi:hypothetical protein
VSEPLQPDDTATSIINMHQTIVVLKIFFNSLLSLQGINHPTY